MKTKKLEINNREIWITVEECYSNNEKFIGYLSYFSTQEPGLLLGELIKNKKLKPILFDNEYMAFESAKEYYLSKIAE